MQPESHTTNDLRPTPEPGQPAPEIDLADATGKRVTLSSFRGRPVVVYFYPKDETAGCTVQACEFRDNYEDFKAVGAEVIGISRDDERAHSKFAAKHGLPFTLLADVEGKAHDAYGVRRKLLGGRITFVVDGAGVVRLVFDSSLRVRTHVEKALALVKSLQAGRAA